MNVDKELNIFCDFILSTFKIAFSCYRDFEMSTMFTISY